jgi:uncharacterized membrane-anchored protein YjiN (DUF445 family)
MQIIQSIQNGIYEIRGERVLLDFDLAELYEVETKVLNQAVKRNIRRFPIDFMFRLTTSEWQTLRSQSVTASQNKRNTDTTPYAFTEQGIAMLSGVLHSDKAINMNIAIMRVFVEIKRILLHQPDLKEQLQEIKQRIDENDVQLNSIYEAWKTCWMKKPLHANGKTGNGLGSGFNTRI